MAGHAPSRFVTLRGNADISANRETVALIQVSAALAAWISATAAGACWIRAADLWTREAAGWWGRTLLASWWLAGLGLCAVAAASQRPGKARVGWFVWLAATPLIVALSEQLAVSAVLGPWHPFVWWSGPAACFLGTWWWRRWATGCLRIWPVRFGLAEMLAAAATVALAASVMGRAGAFGF